ncbi:uncharacterized protein LOC113790794 isoform X2 [Dermatophagoides pteronyssinus]|uniref:uncharacterized protein LOC113790794 isoform X2 n=1 Tax=Dermatophagoides pteronyssinus TaxID=6956 RepID=UPI003F6639ED
MSNIFGMLTGHSKYPHWNKPVINDVSEMGYTNVLEAATISQSHFTPLAEALYRCIDELGTRQITATYEQILKRLCTEFPSVELPADDIIRSTLLAMTAENKLNYDSYYQTYTVASNFILPWGIMDEFESLSLSDRTPPSKQYHTEDGDYDEDIVAVADDDDDDMTIDSNNRQNFNNFEKNQQQSQSTTTDDDFSDCIATNKKLQLLQRRNSLSNDNNSNRNGNHHSKMKQQPFRRSKSFKLNYKTTTIATTNQDNNNDGGDGDDDMIDKEQTKFVCSPTDMMLKRQSLLGKLFKLNSKGRPPPQRDQSRSQSSSTSPSSLTTIPFHSIKKFKCNDFGSQFPEENLLNNHNMITTIDDNDIIAYDNNNDNHYRQQNNHFDHHHHHHHIQSAKCRRQFLTKSTQTVKSGPEEIITVVMRQSGRHALSRSKRLSKDGHNQLLQQQQQTTQQLDVQGVCCIKNQCLSSSSSLPPTRRNHNHHGKCSSCVCCCCCSNPIELKSTRDKKSRHIKHHHQQQHSSINECHRCCHTKINGCESKACHHNHHNNHNNNHNHHNHRKQSQRSTSSIRQHHNRNNHRKSLIDYYIDDDDGQNIGDGNFYRTPSSSEHIQTVYPIIMSNNKSGQNGIIDHRLNNNNNNNNGNLISTNRITNLYLNDKQTDDKCLDLFNLDNDDDNHNNDDDDHWTRKHLIQINDDYNNKVHLEDVDDKSTTGINTSNTVTSSQDIASNLIMAVNSNDNNHLSKYDNHHYQNQHINHHHPVSTNGNIFVNNSVSVKIEIETSSSMTATENNNNRSTTTVHRPINCKQIVVDDDDDYRQSSTIGHRQQQQQLIAGAIFTNGTYSQFDFDQPPKHYSNSNINPNPVNVKIIKNNNNNIDNNRFIYPPELNYANSVTALKEQIARAKANFFKESL